MIDFPFVPWIAREVRKRIRWKVETLGLLITKGEENGGGEASGVGWSVRTRTGACHPRTATRGHRPARPARNETSCHDTLSHLCTLGLLHISTIDPLKRIANFLINDLQDGEKNSLLVLLPPYVF